MSKAKAATAAAETIAPESSLTPLKQGHYSDGHPLDDIQYLEAKLILKGERFTSVLSFHEYGAIVARVAASTGVGYSTKGFKDLRPAIREVLFMDTHDYKLYNNAFILRRRIPYEDGFLMGDPEMVFKFRHPDMQSAAELDMRPTTFDTYKIKFKAELLPLKNEVGGLRTLYSHNVEFPRSALHDIDCNILAQMMRAFPALDKVPTLHELRTAKVEQVNRVAVGEVLLDIGMLDFGHGITAKCNMSVWRRREDEHQLVGEFAFQVKFKRRDELHAGAMKRVEQFMVSLQMAAPEWLELGVTKTAAVYRLSGNPPQSHE